MRASRFGRLNHESPLFNDMYILASLTVRPEAIRRPALLGSTAKIPKPAPPGRLSGPQGPPGEVPSNLHTLSSVGSLYPSNSLLHWPVCTKNSLRPEPLSV